MAPLTLDREVSCGGTPDAVLVEVRVECWPARSRTRWPGTLMHAVVEQDMLDLVVVRLYRCNNIGI